MVASRQVEIPYYRAVGRQRGRGFGALAQVIGRTAIPFFFYAHKSYISNNFKAAISEYKGVLHCEGYDYEQDPEDIANPLPDPFFYKEN